MGATGIESYCGCGDKREDIKRRSYICQGCVGGCPVSLSAKVTHTHTHTPTHTHTELTSVRGVTCFYDLKKRLHIWIVCVCVCVCRCVCVCALMSEWVNSLTSTQFIDFFASLLRKPFITRRSRSAGLPLSSLSPPQYSLSLSLSLSLTLFISVEAHLEGTRAEGLVMTVKWKGQH